MKEKIVRFIALSFKIGVCNLKCPYCYVGQRDGKMNDIPFTIEEMKKAFSKKRLGGTCFINICSDGETLIHPMMPSIIKCFLDEGHYVMVVTNGLLSNKIEECLLIKENLDRLFFKLSFHYEEMERIGVLDTFFNNVNMIKKSPCSFTVEYITCDETLNEIEKFKSICNEKLGVLPQINMPRRGRASNLGIESKYTWKKYLEMWDNTGIDSEFFEFRRQVFGKKYRDFCYAGERMLWIDMSTGYSRQCYSTPDLQNFMGELDKPVKWLAVGNNCREAHCYVAHTFMTLGIAPFPGYVKYKPTYGVIRNRICSDGTEWLKPTYKKAFRYGISGRNFSDLKKVIINKLNILLKWKDRLTD